MERSRILVAKSRALRGCGVHGLRCSMDCLSEAISLLRDAKLDSSGGQAFAYHQLATTYCLHAQCAQEYKLDFEVIMGDITSALDLWLKIDIEHYVGSDGSFQPVATNMVLMLCSSMDLLSIKGFYKYHSCICMLMSKVFKLKCVSVQELFSFLFSHRRLGHTNCGLQIDLELISSTLQTCDARAYLMEFWASCLKDDNASLSMFAQSFLLSCLAFSETNKRGFEKSLQCKIGIDEIKQITSSLISDPKAPNRSAFIAGYLHFDLSQRLLSEGKLFEALSYAEEAFNLREKLLGRKFMYVHRKSSGVKLETLDSVATDMWPGFTRVGTITDFFLSPWIVLKSFLESIFQLRSISELIGNAADAQSKFQRGKEISRLQLLHSFEITFASSLGQLYRKQQLWDMAEREISSAQKLLLESKPAVSSENCKMFLETAVSIQLGDLLYSRYKNSPQDRSLHTLQDASCAYQSAFYKLENHELPFSIMEEAETEVTLNSKCKFCMLLKQSAESDCIKKASRNRKGFLKELNLDSNKLMQTTRGRFCNTSTVNKSKEELATEINNSKRMRKKPSLTCIKDSAPCTVLCWACLVTGALDSGSLSNLLYLGVEFRRCSFLLSLQLKIARTFGSQGEKSNVHEIHSLYSKCIFLFFSRSHGANSSGIHVHQLMELIADEKWKALSIDRALILYSMSLSLLKNGVSDQFGNPCCSIGSFQMQDVVTWLLRAFIFSQEFPLLLQKVSRLLASTLILSSVDCSIHLPLHLDKSLSLNHWAPYFHQASISTSLNTLYQCGMNRISPEVKAGGMNGAYSNKFLRFSFENICQLEEHVGSFFKNLPDVPIICISTIGRDYAAVLEETLILPSFPAWVMLSRIDSTNQPITMFLPADEIREAHHHLETFKFMGNMQLTDEWKCPWVHTVLDYVTPSFKLILKENFWSQHETSDAEKYWKWRMMINNCLDLLLGSIDKSWFGPWSCLLMGPRINNQNKEILVHTLVNHIEPLINSAVNPSLMFPWESLPRLRSQEVYRMPSIGSILLTLDRNYQRHKEKQKNEVSFGNLYFPTVDPFDTYYLLDPKVDLEITEVDLKPWLEGLNFELLLAILIFICLLCDMLLSICTHGRTGAPTSQELCLVLRNHDMFFYCGHGSGTQYSSIDDIERLEIRAGALLMGCSSGALECKGSYAPEGAALSYLFAGSPAVIANLWDVTDREIDKFSKEVVNSWVQEAHPSSCLACALDEKPTTGRGRGRKRQVSGVGKNRWCEGCATRRIASSISKARDACKLSMLTGAAPVCYGVPTVLRRKGKYG